MFTRSEHADYPYHLCLSNLDEGSATSREEKNDWSVKIVNIIRQKPHQCDQNNTPTYYVLTMNVVYVNTRETDG